MSKHTRPITDQQVESEIQRLENTEEVKLARYENYLRTRRRQYLYNLRNHYKHGKELIASGITREYLKEIYDAEVGCDE